MLLNARWILVFLAGLFALTLLAALPASAQDSTATVELRVWQRITNPLLIYVSARHEAGSWATLGTIPLPLDQQTSSGVFRYGDISLEVPLGSGGGGEPDDERGVARLAAHLEPAQHLRQRPA